MITSPPYPGDHEYTKYSKLELILDDLAGSLSDFKTIKQRMLRGSTTNIYKDDSDGDLVRDIESINAVTLEIDRRLREDGATSGFEKLYTKLIWEYFGGMYRVFEDSWKVLKPGAKFSLLVSDSHAFKMVHIKTAELLEEVAMKAGFVNCRIDLWQYKISTSHKYKLLENILTIEKPSVCGK
jgi:DNA modification methylase